MAVDFLPILLLASLPGLGTAPASPLNLVQENPAPSPPKPFVPPTLKEALKTATWDPEQRGPLLILAPDVVMSRPLWAVRQEEMRKAGADPALLKPPFPAPASNGEYRVPELAEFYGRRVVRLNGITVLAPETMVALNDNPGEPDIFAGMRRSQKMQMFESTLSESQWGQMGSEQGLGVGDLKDDQRGLFLSLLPNSVSIIGQQRPSSGPTSVTESQRLGMRLRLSRTVRVGLISQVGGTLANYVNNSRPGDETLRFYSYSDDYPKETAFGQKVRTMVPVRLKAQQIDFEAASLNPRVSLDEAKTVGDLIQRIRAATRLDLYVDPRLGKQVVWLKSGAGATIRAGDLLRSLCWGVAGAVRYLEEGRSFILTDDIVGWGTRVAKIQSWYQAGQSRVWEQQRKYAEAIRQKQPLSHLKPDASDPFLVKPDRMADIEAKAKTGRGRYEGIAVPFASLTAEQQELVRASAADHNTMVARFANRPEAEYMKPVDLDTVRMTLSVRTVFSVPGIGDLEDSSVSSEALDSMLPPPDYAAEMLTGQNKPPAKTITFPAKSSVGGVLKVAPQDAAQAKVAVGAARQHGFRQVWIMISEPRMSGASSSTEAAPGPGTPSLPNFEKAAAEGKTLLAAAIEEANADPANPIAVTAVASVLTVVPAGRAPGAGVSSGLDINILGETSVQAAQRAMKTIPPGTTQAYARFLSEKARDWLLPDTPGLAVRLKRYLSDLASVPGLSGMTLVNAAAPGYRQNGAPGGFTYANYGGGDNKLGYTSAYRAAFLRSDGCDPIDLAPFGSSVPDLSHPLLGAPTPSYGPEGRPVPDGMTAVEGKWDKARYTLASGLMNDLYTALNAEKPLLHLPPPVPGKVVTTGGTPLQGKFALYLLPASDSLAHYILWDKPGVPVFGPNRSATSVSDYRTLAYRTARSVSSRSLMNLQYVEPSLYAGYGATQQPKTAAERAERFAQIFNQTLDSNEGSWDGYVIDLSDVKPEEIPILLSVVRRESPPPRRAAGKTRS